jgi:UDP-3-O-[3-hydroxymyristoyl] N-acetylglucosamine deacetylase
MKTPVILLVDDEQAIIDSLSGSLEDEGYSLLSAPDGSQAMRIIKSQPVDIVFLDIWLPGMDGMETLKCIKDFDSAIEVVMMTGHGTVNTAVQAVKHGAFDFLEKPFSLDVVLNTLKRINEKWQAAAQAVAVEDTHDGSQERVRLIGEVSEIIDIRRRTEKIAVGKAHVFLCGEAGTGKEIVARMLRIGKKSDRPAAFYRLNCPMYDSAEAALELFGDRSVGSGKAGLFTHAGRAVVYLASVDALEIALQDRIAAFLHKRSSDSQLRVAASSLLDIDAALEAGKLSADFAACFAERITLPSLRSRRGDIPLILQHFMSFYCRDYGLREKSFDDDALEMLMNYDWPGNVKELKNLVEKIVVSVHTQMVSSHDIPLSVRDDMQYNVSRYHERYASMQEAENAWRKNYLLYHLRRNDRDIKQTAEKINITKKLLKKYINEYNIILSCEHQSTQRMQRTLKRSMVLSGRGLHSGDKTGLILTPLPAGSGILFGNISSGEVIPANIDYVVSTDYATSLQHNGAAARTIEHFLAVLHAYRITNLMIKINNEVPIMDGSAVDFCQMIEDAGIEDQEEPLDEIIVDRRHTVGEANRKQKFLTIEPADTFSIHYTLNYPRPVGHQEYTFVMAEADDFKREIAPARTFGFLKDIEALNEKGLASGGRLNNFILIDDEKIVNTDLRFPDEFVRHKILDMVGDLYLLGRPLRAKITANMTGHSDNIALVRLLRDIYNP